jgi:excinuclease ABC subunit B
MERTIGRAARNVNGQVIMYADQLTDSMRRALDETNRRRALQLAYNAEHGIDPQTIRKKVGDIIQHARAAEAGVAYRAGVPNLRGRRRRATTATAAEVPAAGDLPQEELAQLIQQLTDEMHEAAAELRFEYAARLRDEITDLKRELRNMREALG